MDPLTFLIKPPIELGNELFELGPEKTSKLLIDFFQTSLEIKEKDYLFAAFLRHLHRHHPIKKYDLTRYAYDFALTHVLLSLEGKFYNEVIDLVGREDPELAHHLESLVSIDILYSLSNFGAEEFIKNLDFRTLIVFSHLINKDERESFLFSRLPDQLKSDVINELNKIKLYPSEDIETRLKLRRALWDLEILHGSWVYAFVGPGEILDQLYDD